MVRAVSDTHNTPSLGVLLRPSQRRREERNLQDGGICGPSNEAPHLYVPNAVVDAYKRLSPQLRHGSCDDGKDVEWRSHPRALGVAHAVDLCWCDVGLFQRPLKNVENDAAVVPGSVAWLEPSAGRGDIGLPVCSEW
jgi:hypothetical protein